MPRRDHFISCLTALASFSAACSSSPSDGNLFQANIDYCPGPNIVQGLDVSEYQKNVNWSAVAASGRGFAIARVSDGSYVDPYFAQNWNGIAAAGMVRGVYQFFRPEEDAVAQANLVLGHIGTLQAGDLAPALDIEVTDGASPATMNAQIHAWVSRIQQATGRDPLIYSGSYFWDGNVGTADFAGLPLWLPAYGPLCPRLPAPWPRWTIHQYSSTGSVPGVGGNVDVDKFDGTLDQLHALAAEPTQPTCSIHCDGNTLVGSDCGQTDCGASGTQCLDVAGGPHCVGVPRGSLDEADCAVLRGWAQDVNQPGAASSVDLYFDDPNGANPPSLRITAGDPRSDLCQPLGSCNHAFTIDTPDALRDGLAHTVYAYGVSSVDPSIHPPLSNSPITFRCAKPLIGDFNGDGKSDLIQWRGDVQGIPVCLSLGDGWSCRDLPANYIGGLGAGNGGDAVWDGGIPLLGHFNHDSWVDLFQYSSTWQSLPVCLSLVSGWSCQNPSAIISPQTTPLVGDFNGDHLSDVVEFSDGADALPVCLSLQSGWSCEDLHADYAGGDFGPGNNGSGLYAGATPLIGDFNGDGRADVLQYNSNWQSIPVCLSLVSGWSCKNLLAPYAGGDGPGNNGSGIYAGSTPLVGDFNGDGRSDVLQYNSSSGAIAVCLSLVSGWSCENLHANYVVDLIGTDGPPGNGGSAIYPGGTPLAGDFNGDGRTDLVQYNSAWSTLPLCLSLQDGWSCKNLLASSIDPIGDGNDGSGIFPHGTPLVGDFNGDGHADVAQYQSGGWQTIPVCLYTGSGWSCDNPYANYTGGLTPGFGGSGIY